MAEHLRHELARSGAAIRPSQVMTLAHFLDGRREIPAAAPPALVHVLIRQALEQLQLPRFQEVVRYRGFHNAIAKLMEEAPAGSVLEDLAAVIEFVEHGLADRGCALRNARLNAASENPGSVAPAIVFDGFFAFSAAERKLIETLARDAFVTVTLPETDPHLVRAGFAEQRVSGAHRRARIDRFAAPTLEREVEEIARRMLDEAARGRQFREMGVILRVREPYASALQTTLARFGIPARFYFLSPLIEQPAIAYLCRILRAMLAGWDHAGLLAALRMPVSGIGATPEGDRFDFETRERLPGAGLPLPELAGFLTRLDPWRRERVTAAEWASRFKKLRAWIPQPVVPDRLERQQVEIWRSIAASLDAFDAVLDETAVFGDGSEISLAAFWERAELALSLEPSRMLDRRRNVVHVMDVFEARQWELPVVFVCGLVERHFPQYHREDSLFNDALRKHAGLPTSADGQRAERFLFELATTRATDTTVLSYSRFNEKGEETLRSFFLPDEAPVCANRVRPAPTRAASTPPPAAIYDPELLTRLAAAHKTLSPTSIEQFVQCPFQFFAAKSLRLRPRPAAPRDRLDVLLQGSILHRALAEAARMPLLARAVFDDVFEEECRRARVPEGYRTEAVRLELLRNLEAFLNDRSVELGWQRRVEEQFSFALNPLLTIRGRIDRMDVSPRGEALVIDYKYSAALKIRQRVDASELGDSVQGGLYLLAAERAFGLEPAGMLYCGLRKDVEWGGWHAAIRGLERVGESSTKARLRELMDAASAKTVETFDAIASGTIAPRPADTDKCKWCDFRDICRVESAAAIGRAGAS
jgi:ATP-dependent helicase/DNAse subunit B